MVNRSPRDTYRQVADKLRAEIKRQPVRDSLIRLGTETELSARFGVARNTLRRALLELAQDGLIHSVPAKGWFIGSASDAPSAPDHESLVNDLASEITSGKLSSGEKLSTAPQIASRYGVTLHAARQALASLAAKGLIESQHGKGWYVR